MAAPASPVCGFAVTSPAVRTGWRWRPTSGRAGGSRRSTRSSSRTLSLAVRGQRGAVSYPDSVGVGMYRIDLHPSTGGDNYIDIGASPFEIPLGALLPRRLTNLIAAGKNIGTTHITNGCYRLHPVEWNIGEVAGMLAAHCLDLGQASGSRSAREPTISGPSRNCWSPTASNCTGRG